jgi:ankyrin repeat protein
VLCFVFLWALFSNKKAGDTAVALVKAGAETDKKDSDGKLALELAPDAQVLCIFL